MENTNIVNLGKRSEEQLDWVCNLTPTHLCITPDTPGSDPDSPASPEFIAASLLEAGYAAVAVYAQPLSDLQQKQGEA